MPYVESPQEISLKTIIPSRKATKEYLGEKMSKLKISAEEREILQDFETAKPKSRLSPKRIKALHSVAEETFKKDRRINIRLSSRDLENLQRHALEEGMPYQTLVFSILHKYISGSLQDIATNKSSRKGALGHASS